MARKHTFPARHGDTFVFRFPGYGDVVFMAVWSNNLYTKMHLLSLVGPASPKPRWELRGGFFEPAKPKTAAQWHAMYRVLLASGVRVFRVANLGEAVKDVVADVDATHAAL